MISLVFLGLGYRGHLSLFLWDVVSSFLGSLYDFDLESLYEESCLVVSKDEKWTGYIFRLGFPLFLARFFIC